MAARAGSRLLNILCLHGYGGNSAVFEHQSRIFRKTFAGSMSFHILQAPAEVNDQPVPSVYAARGLLPPYFGWYRIGQSSINEHGQHELKVSTPALPLAPICLLRIASQVKFSNIRQDELVSFGIEASLQLLAHTLTTHGPFDGALCFSQGGIFLRHAHRIMFDVDRAAFVDAAAAFPKFAICVASPFYSHMLVQYHGIRFGQSPHEYTLPMPACFLYGDKDEYRESFNAHTLFHPATVISYQGGHSFPKSLPDEGFRALTAFVAGQYLRLLGAGFAEPVGEAYGDGGDQRGEAAKM